MPHLTVRQIARKKLQPHSFRYQQYHIIYQQLTENIKKQHGQHNALCFNMLQNPASRTHSVTMK